MEKKKRHFEQEIEEGCAMARITTDDEADSDEETERRASKEVKPHSRSSKGKQASCKGMLGIGIGFL